MPNKEDETGGVAHQIISYDIRFINIPIRCYLQKHLFVTHFPNDSTIRLRSAYTSHVPTIRYGFYLG